MRVCGWVAILSCLALPAWAQRTSSDLTQQSLEDLMNIEVTSVSRKQEKLSQTPSAIFVIRSEDISRSGATNIPDLLRMVPGVHVAQINANKWAISVRGFTALYDNKLLVMLDGRSVYTETFGGVYWDALDLPLENIERIEVIRGPGAAAWGANAVNGVVNIITKNAADTHGALVVSGGGTGNQEFATTQYGGKLGKNTDYRMFTKYSNQGQLPGIDGSGGADGWHSLRGGFRTDSKLSVNDTLMLKGDLYTAREGIVDDLFTAVGSPLTVNTGHANLSGAYLQSVWEHAFANGSGASLETSFDSYKRNDVLREERKTFNVDFQHHFAWGRRQDIVWGLGFRNSDSNFTGNTTVSVDPASLDTQLFSGFVQDEITLIPKHLTVTVGAKLEHNHYTQFHASPSARIEWMFNDHSLFWAAASEAIRTPAVSDTDVRVNLGSFIGPGGIPILPIVLGDPTPVNEGLVSYEVGHRKTISDHLSVDIATFYSHYSRQQTIEPSASFIEDSPSPTHLVVPLTFQNLMQGETHGVEISGSWKVNDRWTLNPGYALERIHMHLMAGSQDALAVRGAEGASPAQSAQLRSHVVLSSRLNWDVSAYFTGRLQDPNTPSYTRLDSAISWRWTEGLSLSLVGQNLLTSRHAEFNDPTLSTTAATMMKRGAYAKFTWRF